MICDTTYAEILIVILQIKNTIIHNTKLEMHESIQWFSALLEYTV